MEFILSFVKSYFALVLVLVMVSYLTPKEKYKKYFQFFIGVLMAVLLLSPVVQWKEKRGNPIEFYNVKEIRKKLESIQFEADKEDIFELFFMENDEG